ncbi:MAG TPA: TIGR00153 family protein [Spongiibacteraceae bacterium]|jgi:predicted phosphate transport protein (TIGR00153 family)|nr:TIGR00153 family protein [Spongiibacteraceae bacterium]HUH38842.1 TIGR00153 family protein [Spongiibacteraceae bacterium]
MPGNPLEALFGRSPIKPMQDHMARACACAELLAGFYRATLAEDWEQAAAIQQEIARLEGEADDLKRDLRMHLPKSLFLPVPRSDLLDLITVQDKIANTTKDIAGLMLGRKMRVPEAIAGLVGELIDAAIATTRQALTAINEMDELLEAGFRGREVAVVEALIQELHRLEHASDELQVKVRAALFKVEQSLPPINVMFLYQIIERIGELADRAQRVGARLEILLAR